MKYLRITHSTKEGQRILLTYSRPQNQLEAEPRQVSFQTFYSAHEVTNKKNNVT